MVQLDLAVQSLSSLITINSNGPAGVDLSVKIERIVEHFHIEGFGFAIELEVVWYSP
jgi:hypothetical protein